MHLSESRVAIYCHPCVLGKGACGTWLFLFSTCQRLTCPLATVYEGSASITDTPIAVKIVKKQFVSERSIKHEISIMQDLQSNRSELVPRLLAWGTTEEGWALAMTMCGSSLESGLITGHLPRHSTPAALVEQMVRLVKSLCRLAKLMHADSVYPTCSLVWLYSL